MEISLLSKLINKEPSHFDETEMVDSNNLYTYRDVSKLIEKFYGTVKDCYKIASKEGVGSFILNIKDITLKICVSPYSCKVYRINGVYDDTIIPDAGFEKFWQRLLIKRNGQSYFDKLEQYYAGQIENIKKEAKLGLEKINNNPKTKEYDEEVVKSLIKQKQTLTNFRIKLINDQLSGLRRYLCTIQHATEVKKGE